MLRRWASGVALLSTVACGAATRHREPEFLPEVAPIVGLIQEHYGQSASWCFLTRTAGPGRSKEEPAPDLNDVWRFDAPETIAWAFRCNKHHCDPPRTEFVAFRPGQKLGAPRRPEANAATFISPRVMASEGVRPSPLPFYASRFFPEAYCLGGTPTGGGIVNYVVERGSGRVLMVTTDELRVVFVREMALAREEPCRFEEAPEVAIYAPSE